MLGHYAVYRARRYRLSRTVYRGLRFHQTGSAWRYAVCAMFWWTLVVLTLGLAYPFAQSRLERFKMRNTFFGNLQGRFEGSGAGCSFAGLCCGSSWWCRSRPQSSWLSLGAFDWSAFDGRGRRRRPDRTGSMPAGSTEAVVYAG